MTSSSLREEHYSLLEYLELNKSGWWDKAIQQIILSVFWLNDGAKFTFEELVEHINIKYPFDIPSHIIRKNLKSLDPYVYLKSNLYIISENKMLKLDKLAEETKEIESSTKEYFINLLTESNIELDTESIWGDFCANLILPYITKTGSQFLYILKSDDFEVNSELFLKFIKKYPSPIQIKLLEVIKKFFNSSIPFVRSFLVRRLNYALTVSACRLPQAAVDTLINQTRGKPKFSIILDTNTIFSLLEWHKNASNEATISLFNLIKIVKQKIKIKFHYTHYTFDEAINKLERVKDKLCHLSTSEHYDNYYRGRGLDGLCYKYLEECKKGKIRFNPQVDFNKRILNLADILNGFEITPLTDRYHELMKKEEVGVEFEKRKTEAEDIHPNVLLHDVLLWFEVKDLRNQYSSISDAKYWILTISKPFLKQDIYYKEHYNTLLGHCLSPTSFFKLLHFYLERTDEIEKSLLDGLSIPILYAEYSEKEEQINVAVIEGLSKYDNFNNLPQQVFDSLVANDTLNESIIHTKTEEGKEELINSSLIDEISYFKEKAAKEESEKNKIKQKKEEADLILHETYKKKIELEEKIKALQELSEEQREVERVLKEDQIKLDQENMKTVCIKSRNETRNICLFVSITLIIIFIAFTLAYWIGGNENFGLLGCIFFVLGFSYSLLFNIFKGIIYNKKALKKLSDYYKKDISHYTSKGINIIPYEIVPH